METFKVGNLSDFVDMSKMAAAFAEGTGDPVSIEGIYEPQPPCECYVCAFWYWVDL